jgi:hypothetical protein
VPDNTRAAERAADSLPYLPAAVKRATCVGLLRFNDHGVAAAPKEDGMDKIIGKARREKNAPLRAARKRRSRLDHGRARR